MLFSILPSLSVNTIPSCLLHESASWCIVDITLMGMDSTIQLFLIVHFLVYRFKI